ncbi:alpha/beta hydrolase [Candidatus Uabimicrobium amorphum]|uniref:Alpha/beta hydrolase n=1 Tax=Uabimicrobium amorphum TaxID=2596890 RepID=A0A5S9INX8_UABAM|nr:alpha/beta hydrolase [Candidatus Uabimicrobium amorphum]BBM85398.1 alpha/beta hydrolase [Candidatus Uabimicrobium amorphum]
MDDAKKTKTTKWYVRVLRSTLLGIFLIAISIRLFGDFLIYYNQRYPIGDWNTEGIKGLEEHTIRVGNKVTLHGWYFPGQADKEFLLFLHGNAGNITTRKARAKLFQLMGYSVFLFDYRGYGKSTGSPSEKGIYKDVSAVFKYVQSNMKPKKLVLFGESIGAAFSIYLATKQPVHALILEAPFMSIHDMSSVLFGFRLPKFLLSSKLPSIERIRNISYPTMVIHGTVDKVIPFSHGKKVYEASPASHKSFIRVEGAGHNGIYLTIGMTKFMKPIVEFLEKIKQND